MLAIVCVKVGDKFSAEDVNRLYRMVKYHRPTRDYKFICYTDNSEGIDKDVITKEPPSDYKSWWSKLGLFKSTCDYHGCTDILYFDLDVVIVAGIDNLLRQVYKDESKLWIMRDAIHDTYNSSVMFWIKGLYDWIYDTFNPSYMQENGGKHRGDQDYISEIVDDAQIFNGLYSYKIHVKNKSVPLDAVVIVFHGKPRPSECQHVDWVDSNYFGNHKRSSIGFAIGNGESRLSIDLNGLKGKGLMVGCNALYRDFNPDILIVNDGKMIEEVMQNYKGVNAVYRSRRPYCINGITMEDMGFASGPTSVALLIRSGVRVVYLIGHDAVGRDKELNNVYKGTSCYANEGCNVYSNFIEQLRMLIQDNSGVNFVFVNDRPIINLFDKCNNVRYITVGNFKKGFGL